MSGEDDTDRTLWLVFDAISWRHVTYLPISPQGRPWFELSYHGDLQQPVEFKIVRTEK